MMRLLNNTNGEECDKIVKHLNEYANYDVLLSIEFDVEGRNQKLKV